VRHISVKLKFILGSVCIIIIIGALSVFLVLTEVSKELRHELRKKGIFTATHFSGMLFDPMLTENYFKVRMMVTDLKAEDADIRYIIVFNRRGEVVSHTFGRSMPADLLKLNRLEQGSSQQVLHLRTEEDLVYDIAVPLIRGEGGYLRLGLVSTHVESAIRHIVWHIESAIRNIVWKLSALIMLAVLFGIGVAVFLGNAIARPITELRDLAEAVGEGDLDVRASSHSNDEIGQLALSFNSMAGKLKITKDALEWANKRLGKQAEHLEDEVRIQTKDLVSSKKRLEMSLEEKEVLLSEVHHRVKNNMAIISSLLNLQSRYTDDERTIEMFSECQKRIHSMALVHERLYQSSDFATIDFEEYAEKLAGDLIRAYRVDGGDVAVVTDIDNIDIGLDLLIPFGLIMNELLTNSLKYAGRTGTLGLRIVNVLVRQLSGEVEVKSDSGTEFRICCALPGKIGV
jgi:two-component sensor histidine kinase/HAMP domain-containing protein